MGLGHEIISVYVVWFDKPKLRENPGDIHNYFNSALIFYWNNKILAV